MSRAGRPRMRSRSVHISSCIPVAPKPRKRTTSAQRLSTKSKGAGKGKNTPKKSNKPVIVVSSDSEDIEVDFPNYHPNLLCKVPAEIPQEPKPTKNAPVEEQQESDHFIESPIEEPHLSKDIPAGHAEEPQDPGNFNPVPVLPPVLMANNQLNWSHFRPEFSGKPEEDVEAHLLRTEDWMTTHDFPDDQKV